nr:hypothetical protein [uncultured Arsenicibacter sp.]
MNYQSLDERTAMNEAVSRREMPWQIRQKYDMLASTNGFYDAPLLIYLEETMNNPNKVVNLCRQVSDSMLLSAPSLYGNNNPNQPYLYDVAKGKLRRQDYEALNRLYGAEMAIPLKDNDFFTAARETIASSVINQPLNFGTRQINTAFSKKMIEDDSRKGAKIITQAIIQSLMAQGENGMAPLVDKNVKMPKTTDEWDNYKTGQQQMESIMFDLLQHIDANVSFRELALQAVDHKTHVNAEFGFVDVRNGQVRPRILHPNQVRWLAGKPITNLEDDAVIAVQVSDYMTGTELVNTFKRHFLNKGTGIRGVLKYIDEIYNPKGKSKWRNIGYDPMANYWTDLGIVGDSWDFNLYGGERQYTSQQVNWMRNLFYPLQNYGQKLTVNILTQWNYFKLFREKRFKVEKVGRDNQRRPATDRELKRWQQERYMCDYEIDITPLAKDEDTNHKNVKAVSTPEVWSFVRIGHDAFLNIGPYEYQPNLEDRESENTKSHWPVVGIIGYENSPVKNMENDAVRANKLWQLFDAKLAAKGVYSKALIIDKTQGKSVGSFLYNGRMSGFVEIDSTKYPTNNNAASQHLKTIEIDGSDVELATLFSQIMQLQTRAEMRVGAGPQVQGISQPYDGLKETQMNIANQQKMTVRFFYQHTNFMNELIQRCADVAKFLYAKDDEILVLLPENQQRILQLTEQLRYCDFGIFVENGAKLEEEMRILDELTTLLMQSGGAERAGALMQSRLIKNPAERAAYLERLETEIRDSQTQAAQAANQLKQQENQLKMAEINAKIQIKQMEIDQEKWREQFRADENRNKEDAKGQMNDIKESQDREKMMLQSALSQEEAQQANQKSLNSQQ